jgi:tetratricopeptide (TPR) repeat protein
MQFLRYAFCIDDSPVARRTRTAIVCSAMLLSSIGCVSQDVLNAQQGVEAYLSGNYPQAKTLLKPLAKKTDENFVLNNNRLGSTGLALYDLQTAQGAFLNSYEVLNSYGVNNGGRTLGAVLVDEKIKIWRGEPFERAMTNFYLGLTYYMQGDYNNARAAFENALFKLKDYQTDEQNNPKSDQFKEIDSNFVLAQYMLARCYQRLGQDDLAAANFKRTVDLEGDLQQLADVNLNKTSNVLLIVDFGLGPHKETNADGALVGFRPLPEEVGPPPHPQVDVDSAGSAAGGLTYPLVDFVALAQDRRWESIDTIRIVKSVLGTGLIAGGAYETYNARNTTDAAVGLGLIAAGALLKASSQADVRVWEMLPRCTYAIPLTLTAGKHDIAVSFPDGIHQTLHAIEAPATGERTYYIRADRYSSPDLQWPPPTLSGWPGGNAE